MTKTDYTREELIHVCEMSIVPEDTWRNRDSQISQKGVGMLWALLKAGCVFEVLTEHNSSISSGCITDDDTIWIEVKSKGFDYFEGAVCKTSAMDMMRGSPPVIHQPENRDELLSEDTHFLPTPKRLRENLLNDWY